MRKGLAFDSSFHRAYCSRDVELGLGRGVEVGRARRGVHHATIRIEPEVLLLLQGLLKAFKSLLLVTRTNLGGGRRPLPYHYYYLSALAFEDSEKAS